VRPVWPCEKTQAPLHRDQRYLKKSVILHAAVDQLKFHSGSHSNRCTKKATIENFRAQPQEGRHEKNSIVALELAVPGEKL
jgi:hypothetical protein